MRAEVESERVFLDITNMTDRFIEGVMASEAGLNAVCTGSARNDRVNIIEHGQTNSYAVRLPAVFSRGERAVQIRRR